MPWTTEQQTACLGCTVEFLEAMTDEYASRFAVSAEQRTSEICMMVMSMLSDAQEEIARDMNETARKTINRAKYLISHKLDPRG